jgi:hypothetical protein
MTLEELCREEETFLHVGAIVRFTFDNDEYGYIGLDRNQEWCEVFCIDDADILEDSECIKAAIAYAERIGSEIRLLTVTIRTAVETNESSF